MADVTSTTLANAINTVFMPGITKTFYEGTPLLRLLGWPFQKAAGGDSIDWKLKYAGGEASLIDEGDTLPAPRNLTFANMTIAPQLVTAVSKITGHAQDFMGAAHFDGIKEELDGGVDAMLHKIEEYCVSQFEAAVNDDTNYGGQTRATVHADSDVTAGGTAALTLAMMSEMYETLQLDPRAVEFDPSDHMLLSAPEQLTAYTEIATGLIYQGDDESAGVNRPYTQMAGDNVLDAGFLKHSVKYNNLPWFSLATMTNSLVFLTRRSNIITREFGKLEIKPLGRYDDADSFQFRAHVALAHNDTYRAARIEALTT